MFRILQTSDVALIVSELRLAGQDITQLLGSLKQSYPRIVTLVLTGHRDASVLIDLINQARIHRVLFDLETAVGRHGVCVHRGAGQGATTRHGRSMPRRSNTALRREGRAIHAVAAHPEGARVSGMKCPAIRHHAYPVARSTAVSRFKPLRQALAWRGIESGLQRHRSLTNTPQLVFRYGVEVDRNPPDSALSRQILGFFRQLGRTTA